MKPLTLAEINLARTRRNLPVLTIEDPSGFAAFRTLLLRQDGTYTRVTEPMGRDWESSALVSMGAYWRAPLGVAIDRINAAIEAGS